MKEVTIQDIAREANVSKSTVSRVLNNTAAVNKDKKAAVLEATERLGFTPNVVARSLASGRSMTIGVLTQLIGSPFYDTISQGIIAELSGTGYWPIFADGRWKLDEESDAIAALLGRRVDGLLLIGGDLPSDEVLRIAQFTPIVLVARQLEGEDTCCFHMDNVDGGLQATQHLIELGHKKIAMIQGVAQHSDAMDRLAGYKQALASAGIEYNPQLVLEGEFTAESGVTAVETLYERGQEFTAIFAANDTTAFGARLALHRRGIRVPEEVSIVGFDDQLEAAFATPPLTTVKQQAREMGEQAARGLLEVIQGNPVPSTPFRGQLQIRESTAPACS